MVLSEMNHEEHIDKNLRIADNSLPNSLTDKEKQLVGRAARTYNKLMPVDCTGCEYCKPCPAGVNIPAAFEVFTKLHLFKNEQEAKFMYAIRCSGVFVGGEEEYASRCVECGECVEKCPQQIDIPSVLKDVELILKMISSTSGLPWPRKC